MFSDVLDVPAIFPVVREDLPRSCRPILGLALQPEPGPSSTVFGSLDTESKAVRSPDTLMETWDSSQVAQPLAEKGGLYVIP